MSAKEPKTIAIINFKGGVGKTTATWCLGEVLALTSDLSVLMFDLDAQMSLTQAIALDESTGRVYDKFWQWYEYTLQHRQTIFDALVTFSQSGQLLNFPIKTNFTYPISDQLHFIPSVDELYWLEFETKTRDSVRGFVRSLISKIATTSELPHYDFIIFDCPPSLTPLSYSVLSCCDLILIPVTPDFLATRGLNSFLKFLKMRVEPYPFPKVAVFMNKVKTVKGDFPTQESKNFMQEVQQVCNGAATKYTIEVKLLQTLILERIGIQINRAIKDGLPEEIERGFIDLWQECLEYLRDPNQPDTL